jgi:hypothetical protein
MKNAISFLITAMILGLALPAMAQDNGGIDPEALIARILGVENKQREAVSDVVFDAEYVEGDTDKNGEFVEKIRFVKRVYVKYLEDTVLFHEDYLEYYKDGELQSREETAKEAASRLEKDRKRKRRNISYPMHMPFYPEVRDEYKITYEGVAEESINGYVCHHFKVESLKEDADHVNGDFYFEAESFHLVRVDFTPAKLVKKLMFKLKKLDMSVLYAPRSEGFWFPTQFDVQGAGKAALFVGVKFAGSEYYRNPVINEGIEDEIFEVDYGE